MIKDRATVTKVDGSGLRYKSKVNGSPFGTHGTNGGTMSCIKCGLHKPRTLGSMKRIAGSSMFFCGECRPVK
jgi:hypothetical protein